MIALAADCLVFELSTGERVPFSADMISVELLGETADLFDADFVRHAAYAVFHYFKHDLNQTTISVAEFSCALEKVLRGFVLTPNSVCHPVTQPERVETDLCRLACESGKGFELFFFPRLREELHQQLSHKPAVMRFHGLRKCVKQLVGARRWTPRCQDLKEQIVTFLRNCLTAENAPAELSMVVH